ncbi:hypothetical protein Dimus_029697 [Dionaea muscipula]
MTMETSSLTVGEQRPAEASSPKPASSAMMRAASTRTGKAKLTRKGHEKSTSASSDPIIIAQKTSTKRKRPEPEEGMISFKISEEASICADPGSLMDSFDSLLLPTDVKRYKELGTMEVANFNVQEIMKV